MWLACFPFTCLAAENRPDKWIRRFENEYKTAIGPVVDFYGTLTISATRQVVDYDGTVFKVKGEYSSSHGCYRRIETADGETNLPSIENETVNVNVFNPDASFSATQPKGKSFFVNDFYSQENIDVLKRKIRLKQNPLFAPYCVFELEISEFVAQPTFAFTRSEEVKLADESLAKLHWKAPMVNKDREGWFVFAPDDHWVLHAYQLILAPKGGKPTERRECEIHFTNSQNGIPVVKEISQEVYLLTNGEKRKETLTVQNLASRETPLQEFTTAAFNIKSPATHSGIRWSLVANAVVMLILAAWLLKKYVHAT